MYLLGSPGVVEGPGFDAGEPLPGLAPCAKLVSGNAMSPATRPMSFVFVAASGGNYPPINCLPKGDSPLARDGARMTLTKWHQHEKQDRKEKSREPEWDEQIPCSKFASARVSAGSAV